MKYPVIKIDSMVIKNFPPFNFICILNGNIYQCYEEHISFNSYSRDLLPNTYSIVYRASAIISITGKFLTYH